MTYRLDGLVAAGGGVGIDVPSGTRLQPSRKSGVMVNEGEDLGVLVASASPNDGPNPGTVATSQEKLVQARLGQVVAPLGGRADLSATSARVEKQGLDVVVPLKPLQELRYRGMGFTGRATVETVLGQRTSECVSVWIETSNGQSAPDQDATPPSATVHCRLPASVETAAGLPAVLSLTSQRLVDVVVIPLIYIGLDRAGANYVVRVQQGGGLVERDVVVGTTDGVRRVVVSGLVPGDIIAPAPS